MLKFIVKYAIQRSIFKRILIEAVTLTEAYVAFLLKFPNNDDYEITEITETTGDNLPADVELPKQPRITCTIC